jgi:hypothetical protein
MSSQRLMHQVFVRLLAAAAIAAPTGGAAIENRPTLELFPMPALETLRETARSAQSLETGLEGLLRDMDLQFQVFEASHCRGAVDDASCQEIEKGLRKTYQQVLDRMIDALPEMERLVGSTRRNLSGTLRSQIGMNLSPRDLQRVVGEKPGSESAARQRTGARVGRLSQQFQRYYEMVSRARGTETTMTMAADIYLDSREALEWIRLARQDMLSARTELDISSTWGNLSPQMMEIVHQVKGLLFGEAPALPDAPDPGTATADANIRALEIN